MKNIFLITAACFSIAIASAERFTNEDFDDAQDNYESEYIVSCLSDDNDCSDEDDSEYLEDDYSDEFDFDEWNTDQNESDMYLYEGFANANESFDDFAFLIEGDAAAEHALYEALNSSTFLNTIINYRYSDRIYPIRVVVNPNNELLFSELAFFQSPETCSAIVIADLPIILMRHLEDRFSVLKYSTDTYVDLRSFDSFIETYGDLRPVEIGVTVDAFDVEIRKLYDSKTFANKVFYYYLNDLFYKVRFISNPKKYLCKAAFSDYVEADEKKFTFSWDDKYGVVTNLKAPQNYIDHWVKAAHASWWDGHFNFRIENGTRTTYTVYEPGYLVDTTTTYTLERIFYVMKNLEICTKK